ncbi:unnamed protein product [Aphanomyces euteiches]
MGVIHLREFLAHFVLFSDPVALQHILVSNGTNYPRKQIMMDYFGDLTLGGGLLGVDGKLHDSYRKMMNPLFAVSKIKSFVDVFNSQTRLYCENYLEPACDTKVPINLANMFTKLALSIVGLTLLGFDFDKSPVALEAYEQSMMEVSPLTLIGVFTIPGFLSFPFPSFVQRRKAQDRLRKIFMQIIHDKLAAFVSKEPKDLLDMILPHATTQEALSHTMTFILAGHDTSSNTLGFVFGTLTSYPDTIAAIRAEYQKVIAHYGSLNSWDAIAELEHTHAVIQQTLRLNAVAFSTIQRTTLDDRVPMSDGSKQFIPKDTNIYIVMAAMHRHSKYWSNPTKFIPERFIEGTPEWNADMRLRGGKSHAFHYMPFSMGGNNCIGQRFAMAEIQLIVATLLSKYDFTPTAKMNLCQEFSGITLKPVNVEMTPRINPTSEAGFDTFGGVATWKTSGKYPEPFLSWIEKFGGAYHVREFLEHVVVVSDPVALQHILVSNGPNYPRKQIAMDYFGDVVLGYGLLSVDGKQHDIYRKLMNPLFAVSKIKTFVEIFNSQTQLYCQNYLEPACDTHAPVNLSKMFTKLMLSIIGLTVLGYDYDKSPVALEAYEQSMIEVSPLMLIGAFAIPGFLSFPIPSLIKRRKAQNTLRNILTRIIHEKLANLASEQPKDLLDMVLPHATTQEAVSHTVTFMLAGHDTSSNTLGFVFGMLTSHPQAIAAIRAEYQKIIAHYGSISSWDAIADLEYTHAVIQETLRLNAVAFAALQRTTLANDNVPMSDGASIFIPQGTYIHINMAAMHRNSKYWSNPTKFIPERFIEGTPEWNADLELRGGKPHTFHYMPFSMGSKNCIGQRFAMAEIQLIVATLVSKYDFTPTAKTDLHQEFSGITLKPVKVEMTVRRVITPSS